VKFPILSSLLFISCTRQGAPVNEIPDPKKSSVVVSNQTDNDTTVYVSFGSNSVVLPTEWSFCKSTVNLHCEFPLGSYSSRQLPLDNRYLNATISFSSPAGCGTTKAEININNPHWYDIVDISLVDGYSNSISVMVDTTLLGPVINAKYNEKIFGVYPLGCDICVSRQAPSCGMNPGSDGCKSGTQFNPDVPCQYQGTVMGGGSNILISLL